jgi:hypothetical protein
MKRLLVFVFLIISVLSLTSCGFMTDFVFVNTSDNPVEFSYRTKYYPYPFALPETPATIPASLLDSGGGHKWKELTPSQYEVDPANRIVTIRVRPREALLVIRVRDDAWHQDSAGGEIFPIEEINVRGAHGELLFKGQQAFNAFSKMSKSLYTLMYN